ncbi:NAD(P)-dependent oxidoreductase [Microbacterium amylolyticum]|uniref:NADH-flavin reductase n=1 Tax=Microbacterium amylolyticum TaxID=936337 RepID=A0ABS4ZHZ1_9MICO|nr:NAD(P)H-binding protein [Microbacterium amylolyticum]MBP2436899.1 putative NADH-flavin reductase [Microbacterium amylolyticum]
MARIVILGGSGYAGTHLITEAASRGHDVTSLSRSLPAEQQENVTYVAGSLLDAEVRAEVLKNADVVISAIAPRGDMAGQTRAALAELAHDAAAAGVRIGIIGGAGSLQVSPGGPRVVDGPDFPDAFKPEALEMTAVLDDLRASDESLDWFFISPAGGFGSFAPGEKLGTFRVGGDVLLVDDEGNSFISGADFATAIIDEVEKPQHSRARFTVAY